MPCAFWPHCISFSGDLFVDRSFNLQGCCPMQQSRYNYFMSKYIYSILLLSLLLACSGNENVVTSGETEDLEAVLVAKEGDNVNVHYTGTLDDGEQFDSSVGSNPLSFTVGAGQMIAGFDAAVLGMALGEKKIVRLEPVEAYGVTDQDLIIDFSIDQLPSGADVGGQVTFTNGATGRITKVSADTFTVDANHKLAGLPLTFEIELISIDWPPS